MSNEQMNPTDWSWFTSLPFEDQVRLLMRPSGELSQGVVEHLLRGPGVAWWAWQGQPFKPMLSPAAAEQLRSVRDQLSHWWQQSLDAEQRNYFVEHRAGEFPAEYGDLVFKASRDPITGGENAYLVVLISDMKKGGVFRLPAVIRVYVEAMSR